MRLTKKTILLFVLSVAGVFATENSTTEIANRTATVLQPEVLTNEGIVALADAGFSDAFIVNKILLSSRTHFDVTIGGLTYLRRNAISENLVLFIIQNNTQPSLTSAAPAAPAVTPVMVSAKIKMKKISVPVESVRAVFAPGVAAMPNSAAGSVASVASPIVTPAAAQAGRSIYGAYGSYGNGSAPYGYSVPAASGVLTIPQVAPIAAVSWWR